jgi:hypothetical protein
MESRGFFEGTGQEGFGAAIVKSVAIGTDPFCLWIPFEPKELGQLSLILSL